MSDDIEALRKDYLAEVTQERRAQPKLSAAARRALTAKPAEMTEAELDRMLVEVATFEIAARLLLDILADEEAPAALRLTALQRIGGAAFQPVKFAPFHAEYVERLRELAVSDDKDLRATALDQLTLMHDEVGQRLVKESLEGTRKPLLPAASAARMLARDEHGDAAPLLRELARTGAPRVREQALRALAVDPESVELLATISSDKTERSAVRELAAMSLKAASPERFADVARDMVLDESEDDRLRTTALSAITLTPEAVDALDADTFGAELEDVKTATKSRSLQASIDRFTESQAPPPE
ncbi:hypothetical protein SAMN04487846_2989 [Microbacterium sp. cf046]|uniref:hypothetical protein n=1 Tax=Microbacterium sp. cf046 TaxID=1761803 RepID=UPI0008F24947|nr:hypothetical protein [Microbacterium sp. cf046]SFS14797.1 hypothetical protein SAMN04487846_2989 [Microbacterium sp. cf046]